MVQPKDNKPWVQVINRAETELSRFVRDKSQPLGKYFESSIVWHAGDRKSGHNLDLKIEVMAIELAKKAIDTQDIIDEDEHWKQVKEVPQSVDSRIIAASIGFAEARLRLHDEIMAQFEFPAMGGVGPSCYWDFEKEEFEATTEKFKARLSKDIEDFIEAVRTHYKAGGIVKGLTP